MNTCGDCYYFGLLGKKPESWGECNVTVTVPAWLVNRTRQRHGSISPMSQMAEKCDCYRERPMPAPEKCPRCGSPTTRHGFNFCAGVCSSENCGWSSFGEWMEQHKLSAAKFEPLQKQLEAAAAEIETSIQESERLRRIVADLEARPPAIDRERLARAIISTDSTPAAIAWRGPRGNLRDKALALADAIIAAMAAEPVKPAGEVCRWRRIIVNNDIAYVCECSRTAVYDDIEENCPGCGRRVEVRE